MGERICQPFVSVSKIRVCVIYINIRVCVILIYPLELKLANFGSVTSRKERIFCDGLLYFGSNPREDMYNEGVTRYSGVI